MLFLGVSWMWFLFVVLIEEPLFKIVRGDRKFGVGEGKGRKEFCGGCYIMFWGFSVFLECQQFDGGSAFIST